MKRAISISALAAVFALLLFGAAGDHAGTQEDPWTAPNRVTLQLAFDNVYEGIEIVRADAELYDAAGVLITAVALEGAELFPPEEATWKIPIYEALAALPNEALYYLQARIEDAAGNQSGWSDKCWVRKAFQELPAPGGCWLSY